MSGLAVGGSFTGAMSERIVSVSVSDPPLATPPESMTRKLKKEGPPFWSGAPS